MRRGSSKPCPGCGEVKPGRPAKEVCRDCRHLLKHAKWMEEQMSKLDGDEIVVVFGEAAHWNEYIYTRSHTGPNLRSIFLRVAKAGSRPTAMRSTKFKLLGKIESFAGTYAIMPKPLAEAVRDLREAVGEALEKEYECGKRDGHNLLMRLADGDLSMNDFNARVKGRRKA